jgi:hypothetical protein
MILVRHHQAERALSVMDGMEELVTLRDTAEEDETQEGDTDGAVDGPKGGPVTGTSQQPGDGGRGSCLGSPDHDTLIDHRREHETRLISAPVARNRAKEFSRFLPAHSSIERIILNTLDRDIY